MFEISVIFMRIEISNDVLTMFSWIYLDMLFILINVHIIAILHALLNINCLVIYAKYDLSNGF